MRQRSRLAPSGHPVLFLEGVVADRAGNLYIGDTGWIEEHYNLPGRAPPNEHVLVVVGIAAPGLIAGMPFPQP